MDKKEPVKDASNDATRESLIAISYPVPEKDVALGHLPKDLDSEKAVQGISGDADGDADEKYRSKLISISNQQSPDIKILPVRPEELNG